MKIYFFIIFLCITIPCFSQSTFIKWHGFEINKLSPRGIITEYDNHYYFSYGWSTQGHFSTNVYAIAKYDTLGNFISKLNFSTGLTKPALTKSRMNSDSTFCSIFIGTGNGPFYRIIRRSSLNGIKLWDTPASITYEDFFVGNNDSIFAIGSDNSMNGIKRQAIYQLDFGDGSILNQKYFIEIPEFQIATHDSAFTIMHITEVDSSLFVLINRIQDTAKFIFEFSKELQYQNHFEIEKDARGFYHHEEYLIIGFQWMTSQLINKGRAVLYKKNGNKLWEFEINGENLNYLFTIRQILSVDSNFLFLTHNYDKDLQRSWQDLYFINYNGQIEKNFRLETATYEPNVRGVLKIQTGYLMNASLSDQLVNIIKTDTCFNAGINQPGGWFLEFPYCGALNTLTDNQLSEPHDELKAFPNPVSTTLTIQTESNETLQYTLSNIAGQVLAVGQVNHSNNSINFSQLPSGLYFLTLQSEQGLQTKKIIKR